MSNETVRRELWERELLERPVAGLQHMLGQLALAEPGLVFLTTDGMFGERTLEAVMVFQRRFGLPVTGIVDRDTWQAIRSRWRLAGDRETRSTRLFPSEGTSVRQGQDREYLILPQTMFQILSRYLEGIIPHAPDGVHSPASADNVRWLQQAAGLPRTGTLDRATWDVLSRLYEVFVVREMEKNSGFSGGWG